MTTYRYAGLNLSEADEKAWKSYEDANAAAKWEYARRPLAHPRISGHFRCMCCDYLTEHPSTICLSCQAWSPLWAELAADARALAAMRHINRRIPANYLAQENKKMKESA